MNNLLHYIYVYVTVLSQHIEQINRYMVDIENVHVIHQIARELHGTYFSSKPLEQVLRLSVVYSTNT